MRRRSSNRVPAGLRCPWLTPAGTCAAAGYLYGWKAVPACEFGCLLGALFGFVLSRGTQKEAVKRQIASLPQKRQEQVPGPRDLALAQPCPRAQNAPTRPPLPAPPQVHALLGGLTTRRAGLGSTARRRICLIWARTWCVILVGRP